MPQYDEKFYQSQMDGSLRSARRILPIIFDFVHPKSVVDVGCGVGTWLSASKELGAADLRGYEGDWVKSQKLVDPLLPVQAVNLEHPLRVDRRFYLAICLEVGERLSRVRSVPLVDERCGFSDNVQFSAA